MLLRCISIQSEPYSLQSKLITTLYLFLVSQLRKKVRSYTVHQHEHGRNIFERIELFLVAEKCYFCIAIELTCVYTLLLYSQAHTHTIFIIYYSIYYILYVYDVYI